MFQRQINPQKQEKLLNQIARYSEDILINDSSKISYRQAYDQIYQLCKHQKQQKILQTVETSIRKVIPKAFSQLNPQSINFLNDVSNLIRKTQKNLQTIKDVCLYLDKNYCKRDMNIELITKLNEIFLQQFFNRSQILQRLGKRIAQQHLKDNQSNIKLVLQAIKMIDQDQIYFSDNFIQFYLPVLSEYYKEQSNRKFTQYNTKQHIQQYIKYANNQLHKQTDFLNKFWNNKKCAANKAFIIKEMYEILVTNFKNEIYANHKQKLFNQLTLQVLELFKYGVKGNDILQHADWYNLQIKERLQTFSHEVNNDFINHICDFYKKIVGLLQKTYNKFDIHYRSRFAFEEWINLQRLQMPLRINEYIKNYCTIAQITQEEDQKILERIDIIFILMKEKKVFQKYYRRQLINRVLNNFENYNLKGQLKIIQLMEKQCSQEFVKNVKPIIQAYQTSLGQCVKQNNRLNAFLINSQNWPYQQKNTSVSVHPFLTEIAQKYTTNFMSSNKDKTLYWHPIVGVVRLNIRFLKSSWSGQLIVNTCMANLILNFIKTKGQPYQLKDFCCQTGYKLDQLYESVRKLIKSKILLNQGNQQNYKLNLNEEFANQKNVFDVLNTSQVNKFEAKPLQELKADRKFMVEAIIVKIMKRLKHTDKQTILKEASPVIQKRGFNFNAAFVQSAIDRLIDKQFIRDFQDGKLGYIA